MIYAMKMKLSYALAVLVSMMICAGCSVKENRSVCPCRLILNYSKVDTSVVKSADLTVKSHDGFIFTDELGTDELKSEAEVMVPRENIEVFVWSGTEGLLAEHGLFIPLGEDCPPVYLHDSKVNANRETVEETVIMRKEHCRMTINLNNLESSSRYLNIIGNVCGYLPDGCPVAGEFRYGLGSEGGTGCVVLLPRQTDGSLFLEISDDDGIVKKFNIGEYVIESGYDWNAPDLQDITIDLDIAITEIILAIQGWDEVYHFEVII